MDCYGQSLADNKYGITQHFKRFAETPPSPSPLAAQSHMTAHPLNPVAGLIPSPNYVVKHGTESSLHPYSHHQRVHSPSLRYSPHAYPPSYKMSPNISMPVASPTPLGYYPSNYDSNCSRGGYLNPTASAIEEYYRNSHYNYQQSFSSYGKLNVPKSSYLNPHLGLPSYRSAHIQTPKSYYAAPRNEMYDPIAGLHQTVRNGFRDNVALSNTYHNIYNYSPPPPLSPHLKKPHYGSPYSPHHPHSHHHPALYPPPSASSYSSFPTYESKPTNYDYYRGHPSHPHPYLNSHSLDYANPASSSAQYHLYQQQKYQQLLLNKHEAPNPYHSPYPNPMMLTGGSPHRPLEPNHSPRTPDIHRTKSPDNRLQSLINEEIHPRSSRFDLRSAPSISEHENSLEDDVQLDVTKNSVADKNEQRADSSVSESNTVNDVNSETTAASSPLTSVSSYTDSGISGCSNNIEASNASDGGSIEDKHDESLLNQSNSMDAADEADKSVEIKKEMCSESEEFGKNEKTEDNDSNAKVKNEEPSTVPPKAISATTNKGVLPESTAIKSFSESNAERPTNPRSNVNQARYPQAMHPSEYNNLAKSLQPNITQSQYHKYHPGNWAAYHQYQMRAKAQQMHQNGEAPPKQSKNSKNNSNSKCLNKNNNKANISVNMSKSRVLECDFIPSKKSRKKFGFHHFPNNSAELREELKDIKPLPAFQQAFGSTEIGRFSEVFQNNSPDNAFDCSAPFDYHTIDTNSPYPWETGDSLDGPHYNNLYRPPSMFSNYSESYNDTMESSKENFFNSYK